MAKKSKKIFLAFPKELRGKDPKDYTPEDEALLDRFAEEIAADLVGEPASE